MQINKDKIVNASFYALMFFIFVSINSITAMLFGVQQLGSPLILACCIIILSQLKINKKSFQHIGIYLLYGVYLSYFGIGLLSRIYHIDIHYRVVLSGQIISFMTSMIMIITVHQYLYRRLVEEHKSELVFYALFIPLIIANSVSIYQALSGALINQFGLNDRASGVFGNANGLGIQANLGLLLTMFTLYSHNKYFWIKIFFIPFFLYTSFLSLSRASMVTSVILILMAFGWYFLYLFKVPSSSVKRFAPIIIIPFLFLLYVTFNFEALTLKYLDYSQAKRLISIAEIVSDKKLSNKNTAGRVEVFEFGFKQIKNGPFFGNGLGFFQYFPEELNFKHGVHNTYLLIWGDSGVFAFIVFICLLLYLIIRPIFLPPQASLFSMLFGILWGMQCIGSHNGLDEKMFAIFAAFAVLYILYAKSLVSSKVNALI